MQKKTAARHVGYCMVFFATKCLICFDQKTRFTPRNGIDFHCNFKITKFRLLILVKKIHISSKNGFPRVFLLDPVVSA